MWPMACNTCTNMFNRKSLTETSGAVTYCWTPGSGER
ncbi:hypothetical protein LINPERPRIM_LOCUS39809 [Linum perenne]